MPKFCLNPKNHDTPCKAPCGACRGFCGHKKLFEGTQTEAEIQFLENKIQVLQIKLYSEKQLSLDV